MQILDHTCLIDPGEVAEIRLQRRVTVMLSRAGLAVAIKPVSNRCGGLLNFIAGRYCLQYYADLLNFLRAGFFSRKKWQLLVADQAARAPICETRP